MNLFDEKNIAPMLIGAGRGPFDSEEYYYELKLDGIRCIAYLDSDGAELCNKRTKSLTALFPELVGIHTHRNTRCILDGELLVLRDGKPYFPEIQRRALMTNPFKIKLASDKLPACFTAFDILYFENRQVTDLPLTERKELLFQSIKETPRLALSRHIETNGMQLYHAAAAQGLEGVVAKRKDSQYFFGKRTKDWIKIKNMLDEDFIICGYYFKSAHMVSLILGSCHQDVIVYRAHVAMGISRNDFSRITTVQQVNKDRYYSLFPAFENVVWLSPELVGTVEFMEYSTQGGLRQPVFKGLRDDKSPHECIHTLVAQPGR